ncbi:acyl-CoA dehydrogenase family protein [Novosphingobium colocasiae]
MLGALETRATRTQGGWLINGAKKWCTSAHVSDYVLLLARTNDEVARKHQGVSLFLMSPKAPGVTLSPLTTLGMRGLGTFDMTMEDVFLFRTNCCWGSRTTPGGCCCRRWRTNACC